MRTLGRISIASCFLFVFACAIAAHAAEPFPGEPTDWQGFARYSFDVNGIKVAVWAPKQPAETRPWALLDSGEPRNVDAALLAKGFHIVSAELPDPFGSPKAVAAWDAVYAAMTTTHGLAGKVVLEGYGLGGLIVYNWAAANAGKVACVYADGAVADFKSYPGGKGKGQSDPELWKALQTAYGFASEQEALDYAKNPIDTVKALGPERVSILHVCGDKDNVVPYKENTLPLRKNYWEDGGVEFVEIIKPGVEHEHGLDDTLAIVNFVLLNTLHKGDALQDATPEELKQWKIADGFNRRGKVHVDGTAVILEEGNDMTGVNWAGPVYTMDYEVELDAMRVAGDDFFCGLTFPYGEDPCSFIVGGWSGTVVGLSCLNYMDASENESTKFMDFQKGRWYHIRLRVTKTKIQAWLDDKQVVDVLTEGKKIDIRYEVEPSRPLGIATWRTTGAVKSFTIRQLNAQEIADTAT